MWFRSGDGKCARERERARINIIPEREREREHGIVLTRLLLLLPLAPLEYYIRRYNDETYTSSRESSQQQSSISTILCELMEVAMPSYDFPQKQPATRIKIKMYISPARSLFRYIHSDETQNLTIFKVACKTEQTRFETAGKDVRREGDNSQLDDRRDTVHVIIVSRDIRTCAPPQQET